MTLREIANELRKQGHSVSYSARSDGSIIINFIDGQKFKGKEGNKSARSMLGVDLSEKQKSQRQENLERAKKGRKSKSKGLSKRELKKLRKLNRKIKKTGSGRLGRTKARGLRDQGGWKAVEEAGKDIMRKNLNIADDSLIDSLESRMAGFALNNDEMRSAVRALVKQHSWIKFENFELMISLIYALEKKVASDNKGKSLDEHMRYLNSNEYKMAVTKTAVEIKAILKSNKQDIKEIGAKGYFKK